MTVKEALMIAQVAHSGKKDKTGVEYITHPVRVMLDLQHDEEKVVALLHDVFEDCPEYDICDYTSILSPDQITALTLLTKNKEYTYESYISRISGSIIARRVKMADLLDNTEKYRVKSLLDITYSKPDRMHIFSRYNKYRICYNSLYSIELLYCSVNNIDINPAFINMIPDIFIDENIDPNASRPTSYTERDLLIP